MIFPFLFGGTFIEGGEALEDADALAEFPFLFGGTFIEGRDQISALGLAFRISLPFRRDFH